jgi:hypothetical protein
MHIIIIYHCSYTRAEMLFEFVITIFAKIVAITYKWLDHHLLVYILNFAREFASAIIVITIILFLLYNVFLTIRCLKKLPKYYVIEIVDADGSKTTVAGLRMIFATYDVAESYARFYRDIYKDQYKFRVVGLKR